MKTCTKCKVEQPLDFFYKRKTSKDGLRTKCKSCEKIEFKIYYTKIDIETSKVPRAIPITAYCNTCALEKNNIEFFRRKTNPNGLGSDCKICIKNTRIEKTEKDRIKWSIIKPTDLKQFKTCTKCKIKKTTFEFYKKSIASDGLSSRCMSCVDIIAAQWALDNPEKIKQNYEAGKPARRIYSKKRRETDIQFKLKGLLCSRLNDVLNGRKKSGSAVRDLGCSIEELKIYLESKFQSGMNWQNHSKTGWHIDHIKPLYSFDLTIREELIKACHYTNLQPLWAIDNLKKSNKIGVEYGNSYC